MYRAFALATLLAAAPVMAQTATATTLPANVAADLATVKDDVAAMKAAMAQVRADAKSNSATIAADRTAARLAGLRLRMDAQRLRLDAAPILQADETALFNALTQLHNDQVGNNASAVTADEAAATLAREQLKVDIAAISGGMHRGRRHHGF